MTRNESKNLTALHSVGGFLGAFAVAAALLGASGSAMAQSAEDAAITAAPPVATSVNGIGSGYDSAAPGGAEASSGAASTVFDWQEIPANQEVPIQRAVFDQRGYQLFDKSGETIVVPFTNNNLYVMKFAVSPNGDTYLVNTGDAPVLYLPRNGYLDNATVSDARWYPFTDDFHPTTPEFVGVAPSYTEFVDTGWAPGLFFYGGFYGASEFGLFTPTFGLSFTFGGHPYYGFNEFSIFVGGHPDYFRPIGFYHPYVYRYAGRGYWGGRTFHGYNGYGHYAGGFGHGPGAFNHGPAGFDHTAAGGYAHSFGGGRTFYGAGRPYSVSTHSFTGGRSDGFTGSHGFGGGTHSFSNGGVGGGFHNASTFHGADSGYGHAGGGYGGHTFNGGGARYTANNNFSGGHSSGGGQAGRSFGGGQGGRSFGGGQGAHTFHGTSGGGGGHAGGGGEHGER